MVPLDVPSVKQINRDALADFLYIILDKKLLAKHQKMLATDMTGLRELYQASDDKLLKALHRVQKTWTYSTQCWWVGNKGRKVEWKLENFW